ncbi:hypothetical protein COHA_009118 [Chlorella ohadii]|uniref:Uncharacterized protein n=1 Tax=Chlorella ohadii TaxID=2649997 RepID=A0AAD5DHM8_9CHLO|nr:hypothetical protein COHA_009118 [Chlorella ohadii]
MAGLAALEFAQALQQLVADRRAGKPTMAGNAGASVTARGANPSGSHAYGWRDAMDIIVRWRQLAEPNDQVIWVDLLTEREFNAGFGSHTPMFTGQTKCVRDYVIFDAGSARNLTVLVLLAHLQTKCTKCVRYYMVFDRALGVMKRVLAADGHAFDANNAKVPLDSEQQQRAAAEARTAEQMWAALGTDSWVVVPIESTTRPGHSLEGTRLTMVNMSKGPGAAAAAAESGGGGGGGSAEEGPVMQLANGVRDQSGQSGPSGRPAPAELAAAAKRAQARPQPDAYEFSIRTPVTPARWKDYDEELAGMFERLVAALAAGDLAAMADAALRFAYYWYNFMPLARGSAFCGYVSMLGAFLAAGAPVQATMPKSYQTDWEAILESSPERFIASVSSWMYPPELSSSSSSNNSSGGSGSGGGVNGGTAGGGNGSRAADGSIAGAAAAVPCPPVDKLPKVIEVLDTMRKRLEALNEPDVPRI